MEMGEIWDGTKGMSRGGVVQKSCFVQISFEE